jgi:hypothetical protein
MYTVYGYTMDCREVSVRFRSFVDAVRFYKLFKDVAVLFLMREQVGTCRYMKP